MSSISFKIEADPVPASRPRVTAKGHAFYPKKHTQYKQYLETVLKDMPKLPTSGPVEVRMMFVMPRYKTSDHPVHRSDCDNLAKLPLDVMTKTEADGEQYWWDDDDLVVHLSVFKRFTIGDEQPHTIIKVKTLEGDVNEHIDKLFHS